MDNAQLPLAINFHGEGVKQLQDELTLLNFTIPQAELRDQKFGVGTQAAILQLQVASGLPRSGIVDASTRVALTSALGTEVGAMPSVEGRILLDRGEPANNMTVKLYRRTFGEEAVDIGTVETDDNGYYSFAYEAAGATNNIELRIIGTDGQETPISATKFHAQRNEVMNLVAPSSVRPLQTDEFARLSEAVLPFVDGDIANLAKAKETKDRARQDISFLHQETRWDPRLIGLNALAQQTTTTTGMSPAALYGMARVGLPTGAEQLALLKPDAVKAGLTRARDAEIVALDDAQIEEAVGAFTAFANQTFLTTAPQGTLANPTAMLEKSTLNANQRAAFGTLFAQHTGPVSGIWETAANAGFSGDQINRLQAQGQLAYLTLNNADLAQTFQDRITSPAEMPKLVSEDLLYQDDQWATRLREVATQTQKPLAELIPPSYVGEDDDARLAAYSADLARKVRLSFPTAVVGQELIQGTVPIAGEFDLARTGAFLQAAEPLGFKLGRDRIDTFVADNREALFAGVPEDIVAATVAGAKATQRLTQITPNNEALKITAQLGFTSAADVVAIPYGEFIRRYSGSAGYGSVEIADLVYRKAEQVSAVVRNFFTIAQQVETAPPVQVMSAAPARREIARNALITTFPTLTDLFGSIDFCACDHCRSALSPAAYFVDLLRFLDPAPEVWERTMTEWDLTHPGAPYPFETEARWTEFRTAWEATHPPEEPPPIQRKPFDVLVERRPDLPFIPLSCENTLTALPYIDVINEIQEYHVAHGALASATARDTGAATTPELLAEPQHVIPAAYDTLAQARYPMSLPFDLWLETVRRMFDHFETPLWRALELFRPTDELAIPTAATEDYGRFDIFREALGLSPVTAELLTTATPVANWHQLYGYADEASALADLAAPAHHAADRKPTAKILARRLGVSYQELTDLVTTWFMNPDLNTLALLYKLGLEIDDVIRYKSNAMPGSERATFEARLATLTNTYNDLDPEFDAAVWLEGMWAPADPQQRVLDRILILQTPEGCSFDDTHLRFADANGTSADAFVFYKLNVFVRLWRALGWTLAETDRALAVFLPRDNQPLTPESLSPAMESALVYLSHLHALSERLNAGKDARLKLLSLWAPLATSGANPLYAQLFLTRNVLNDDPVFDHQFGAYLSVFDETEARYVPFHWDPTQPDDPAAGNVSLRAHLPTVQEALNLTAEQITAILAVAGSALDTAALTLDAVSLLYRYGFFAKSLGLSVAELITLRELAGPNLDPFTPLETFPMSEIAHDHPFNRTLGFVDVVDAVAASGFEVADLDYLLRHRFDPVGGYRPDAEALLALVKGLASGLGQIDAAHAVPADVTTITDDFLRQELSLLLPAAVTDTFLRMWTGAEAYSAVVPNVPDADQLLPAEFAREPEIQVSYDADLLTQRLTFRGVLLEERKTQLLADHPRPNLETLLNDVQAQARTYFDKHLSGLLTDAGDFDALFTPDLTVCASGDTVCEVEKQKRLAAKRARMANAFVPAVRRELARQFVTETIATELGADPALTATLLGDAALLEEPEVPGGPLLDAFTAVSGRGVSARFSATPQPATPEEWGAAVTAATVDSAVAENPGGSNSIQFEGYFEVPEATEYVFLATSEKANATVELVLADRIDPLFRATTLQPNEPLSATVGDLKPGVPYRFIFTATNLAGGSVILRVRGGKLPLDAFSQLVLYPAQAVRRAERARTLLAKATQLIDGWELSEGELRYFTDHASDFAGFDLSALPTAASEDPAAGVAPFAWFLRLTAYVALRAELGASDELIDIFARSRLPGGTFPGLTIDQISERMLADLAPRIADLTRRDPEVVLATAAELGIAAAAHPDGFDQIAALTDERGLRRLWEALQIVERFGVPVASLASWVRPDPDAAVAADLRRTVKARYDTETWQRVAPSIFDPLRQRQRDALVAHLQTTLGYDRIEQLFEYFLVDPGMEPVVQTSRIRLAIASIQLFVQRCFLNLEPWVHPSVLDSQHWQWMKRYRVWEANRKIFIYPENWLEPEFRDDKTHLYLELEGTLLSSDVSDELVEDAFFVYLKRLEEIAQLEIVTMHAEEHADPARNVLHVVGRTASTPYKYFYRRFARGAWTPWEPVTAEIEGDHVVAVMWRSRLHLFWVTFMPKADKQGGHVAPTAGTEGPVAQATLSSITNRVVASVTQRVEVWLNWSDLYQGEWSVREAATGATYETTVLSNFDSRQVSVHVSKDVEADRDGPAWIHLNGPVNVTFRVASKNSRPRAYGGQAAPRPMPPYAFDSPTALRNESFGAFFVNFADRIEDGVAGKSKPNQIFAQSDDFTIVGPSHQMRLLDDVVGPLLSPFFYADDSALLFGIPDLKEETFIEWQGYIPAEDPPDFEWDYEDWWINLEKLTIPQVPEILPGPYPFQLPEEYGPTVIHPLLRGRDLVVNDFTVLRYDEGLLGRTADPGLIVLPAEEFMAPDLAGVMLNEVAVTPGSSIDAGTVIVAVDPGPAAGVLVNPGTARGAGFSGAAFNVVGRGGVNGAMVNVAAHARFANAANIGALGAFDRELINP